MKTQDLGLWSKKNTDLSNEVRDLERKLKKAEQALTKASQLEKGTFEQQCEREKRKQEFELEMQREKNKASLLAKEKEAIKGKEQRSLIDHRAACNMEVQANKLNLKEQERQRLTNARTK